MTAAEVEKLNREHEKRIRCAFLWGYGLCVCAVIPLLFLILGICRPQAELFGQWFARSGAVMSAIAVVAQFKANGIAPMISRRHVRGIVGVLSQVQPLSSLCRWIVACAGGHRHHRVGIWRFAVPPSPRHMIRSRLASRRSRRLPERSRSATSAMRTRPTSLANAMCSSTTPWSIVSGPRADPATAIAT